MKNSSKKINLYLENVYLCFIIQSTYFLGFLVYQQGGVNFDSQTDVF